MEHPWGRVAQDGTVYVRTEDGERAVGVWAAGPAEEGLAHFEQRFRQLEQQAELLDQRVAAGVARPAALHESAQRLKATVHDAAAVGDLAGLERRIDDILGRVDARVAEESEARRQARQEAAGALTALVEEAERLADTTSWKAAGDRLREISTTWSETARTAGRSAASTLWPRLAAAERRFNQRRREHFAARAAESAAARERKDTIVAEAESLAGSTDWAATANRFRELMAAWRAAGHAPRPAEQALWERFRAAQNEFFTRRSAAFAERDAKLAANLARKEELVAQAEGLDLGDPRTASRTLRELEDRYGGLGPVPREASADLERRLAAAAARVRSGSRPRGPDPASSPLVTRLKESVEKLERRAERARAAGRDEEAAQAEASLATQRAWLERAQRA